MNRFGLVVFVLTTLWFAPSGGAVTRTWTGAAGNHQWSMAANWSPAGRPVSGDALVFPAGFDGASALNDVTGLTLQSISFASGVHVLGNAFKSGPIDNASLSSASHPAIDNDVEFTAPCAIGGVSFRGHVKLDGSHTSDLHYTISNARFEGVLEGEAPADGYCDLLGGGPYSGTFRGSVVLGGSYPNAEIIVSGIYGDGSAAVVSAQTFDPGDTLHSSLGQIEASLKYGQFGTYVADLTAISSDRVVVHGPMLIPFGSVINVRLRTAAVVAGTAYTIIDKDGADAILNSFLNAPEGAILDVYSSVGDVPVHLTYKGGDGNDVILAVEASSRRWTNAARDSRMSNPANWVPGTTPAAGEVLFFPPAEPPVFPSSGGVVAESTATVVNDLPAGTTLSSLLFSYPSSVDVDHPSPIGSSGLTGNALTITDLISGTASISAPVTLRGTTLEGGTLSFTNAVISGDVGGDADVFFTGALAGSGTVTTRSATLSATGSFDGAITTSGSCTLSAVLPNASIHAASLTGSGTVRDIAATHLDSRQSITGRDVTLGRENVSRDRPPYSALSWTPGGVVHAQRFTIAGPLEVNGSAPVGTVFTILDNLGSEPIHGTFRDLPEGAIVTFGKAGYWISYHGGDGNDVTLTTVPLATKRRAVR